jgi:ankyrin repeat protein
VKNQRGFTPLHSACYYGAADEDGRQARAQVAELLVAAGADVKAADVRGNTALHLVALKGRVELLQPFAAAGGDVNASDTLGRRPLHLAVLANHPAVVDWLLQHKADVDAQDRAGETPLHSAARRFRKEAAERLLNAGADVNARNLEEATPLVVLASQKFRGANLDAPLAEFAGVLLHHGADVRSKDQTGATALDYARERKRPKLADAISRHVQETTAGG